MAVQAQLADGRILEFPDGTDPAVIQSTVKRVIASTQPQQAGFSLGDIAASFAQGAYGSTQALTDVFGAGNTASSKLEELARASQADMTPGRQAELLRQQERAKAAEQTGSSWEEIKAAIQNVAESPLQSAAQAVGSFVPYIPAMFAGPAAAALGLGARATAAATAAARVAPGVIGTAQGAGAVKGAIYDAVYEAEIKDGTPEDQARAKAEAAQNYAGANIDQIASGAGIGYVAGRFGAERLLSPGAAATASRSAAGRVGTALATDVPTEALQGGQERLAANIALQREGMDVPTFQGVAGQAAQEGILGALGSGPIAAVRGPDVAALQEEERRKELEAFEAEKAKVLAAMEPEPVEPEEPVSRDAPIKMPGGFTIQREELSRETVPESYGIFAEGQESPLTKVASMDEANQKAEAFKEIRQKEQENLLRELDKVTGEAQKRRDRIDQLEATGQTATEEYQGLKANIDQLELESETKAREIAERMEQLGRPLNVAPIGEREQINERFNLISPVGRVEASFGTPNEAEASLRELFGEDVFKQFEDEAAAAKQKIEAAKQKKFRDKRVAALEEQLVPKLRQFGLQDVGLKIVDQIENGAGGAYLNKLIRVAFDEANPLQTVRHESMHALKELGFFTPQQWKALELRAERQWIKEFLENQITEIDGVQMTRLEGYQKLGLSREAIIEEAIADAFGAYARGVTPPPGMIAALFKKLKNFFANFGQALRGAGFESADDIFQRVERGELKPAAAKGLSAEKLSLPIVRGEEKPEFKVKPTVDAIAKYFDDQVKEKNGGPLDFNDKNSFDLAVKIASDEVAHQMSQEKSGLDWYEDDIKSAFKETAKVIPELKKTQDRLLFSVMAGIMSPQTNARDNWNIAAKAYEHYLATGTIPGINPETNGLWQGGTQSANKKIQLEFLDRMVKDMGAKKALNWLFEDHTVKEINDFRAKYGNIKSGIDGKLGDMRPGLYAFGPKVGPFVSNLNGIHDVTVDKWMTRTFNRYFGTMAGPDGKIIDAPTEPQRRAVKALVNEVAKNAGIKPYQVQSLLWFYEQQLFTKMGVPSPSYGFSDGAKKFTESRGDRGGAKGVGLAEAATERKLKRGEANEAVKPEQPSVRPGTGSKLSLARSERGGVGEPREVAPLEGAPSVAGFSGPIPEIVAAAERYAKDNGIPYKRQASYVKVDPERANRIAQAYEEMAHAPQDPKVRAAYEDLIRQTTAQYKALVDAGYKFWFMDMSKPDNQEYASSPWNAMRDLKNNKQMGVFPTNDGFGSDEDFSPEANPLLADTGIKWPAGDLNGPLQPVLANDLFRAVHDAFGHGIEGAGFRADGEENAWQAHVRLFTGPAVGAITSETRGQNSWLNYGPYGDKNRTAKVEDTVFADQKTGLMPDWTWKEGGPEDTAKGIVLGKKQPKAQSFDGVHYGKAQVDELSGSKYGTGLRGAERRRLDQTDDGRIKRRAYFYIQKPDGTMPVPEAGVGSYVYTQKFDNILGPGPEMSRLFREADADSNTFESLIVDAGYDGYAVPNMGMMVILNHDVPVISKGTRAELLAKGEKYSLKRVGFPSVSEVKKAVAETDLPSTQEFKTFIGGSKWLDKNGEPMRFYHATAREFFEFTPAGQSNAIFLATTPEEAETFGSIAEDRLRREVYKAITKDEKLAFFQRIVDAEIQKGTITEKEGAEFIRQAKRKVPDYGNFGDIEAQVYDALLDLSPTRMSIMPLYARAETPFDFENPQHVEQVMRYVATETQYPQDFPEKWLAGMKGRISQGLWQAIEDKRVQQAIRALGFDAFAVRENRNSPKNYAVYQPQQVKSITGNDGQFSLENKDMRFSLKNVRYSPERFQTLYDESVYYRDGEEKKTKGYLAFVDPMEFVEATANRDMFARLRSEEEPVDFEKMRGLHTVPTLNISIRNGEWKIIGHEGRHRMLALHNLGYKNIPVFIQHATAIDNAEPLRAKMIKAQFDDALSSTLMAIEIEPLSYANKDKAMEKFTGMDSKVKYSLPKMPSALDGRVSETTTSREEKTFVQSIIDAISPRSREYFRQKAINRYDQLSKYDKKLVEQMGGKELLADQSAEAAALMSDLGSGVAASAMGFGDRHGGIPVYKNGVTTIDRSVKGLIASLAPLARHNDPKIYQYYQYWAMVKRGVRLNAQGKETGIDNTDVQYAKYLQQKFPEFVQVQKDFIAFNNGLVKYAKDTGVISEQNAQEFVRYADYVPFYRQMDGETTVGPNIFQSITEVKGPKKLKGGTGPLADFLETAVRNTTSMIQAGMKNSAGQRAVDVVTKVKAPGMGAERLDHDASGPDIFHVLEKGKRVSYRTPDHLLLDAISSMHMPELPFMGILSAPANMLRNLVTKDPGFMMANLLRDSLSSYVTSGQKMTPIAGTVINFGKVLAGKSKGFEALMDAGVIGGYELSQNIERSGYEIEQDLAKKAGKKAPLPLRPFTWLWEGLEKGTEASDAATRAMIYERVLKDTGNEAEALFRSLEVMNFNRKGNSPLIRVLTAAVPFLNARIQGLDLFYRASTGNMNMADKKAIQRKFWARGATMMALSCMYWALVHDDEEYKTQEQETRDNNWLITGLGIKIPIPFEVGVLFKTIPERIMAYSFGNDTGKDLMDSMKRNAISTFAFNPIPQTVKPLVEATTNFNFFTWRPIIGQGMQDVALEYQVGPGTSKAAKFLGEQLGLSPMKVDHVIKGYTGTMGTYAVDLMDSIMDQFGDSPKAAKRFEQMPVIKRFTIDPEARGTVTAYYELKDAVDTTVRTMNLLESSMEPEKFAEYLKENMGTLAVKDYVRDLEGSMKEFREMRNLIRNSSMTAEQKRDGLLTITSAENNLTQNIQEVKKAIASLQ